MAKESVETKSNIATDERVAPVKEESLIDDPRILTVFNPSRYQSIRLYTRHEGGLVKHHVSARGFAALKFSTPEEATQYATTPYILSQTAKNKLVIGQTRDTNFIKNIEEASETKKATIASMLQNSINMLLAPVKNVQTVDIEEVVR